MVKTKLLPNNQIWFAFIQEQNFELFREMCQFERLYYNSDMKGYVTNATPNIFALLHDFEKHSPVIWDNGIKELEQQGIYPKSKELKYVRIPIDKELVELNPPLKGINGHENFQSEAISKCLSQNRILLSISCRHGKTYITSIAFGTLLKRSFIDRVLIICRPEGMVNFKNEILRFIPFIEEDDIALIYSYNREIENYFDKKIIITCYNTFRLTCEHYNKSTSKKPKKPVIDFSKWGKDRLIILDECQSINSSDTLQTHWIQLHKNFFDRRIEMSGSLGYKIGNMYSHVKFLTPDSIPFSPSQWKNFMFDGKFKDKPIVTEVERFRKGPLKPLLVSYSNCIKNPKMYEEFIYVEMNDKMKNVYQQVVNEFLSDVASSDNGAKVTYRILKSKFPYLAQVTDDCSLLDIKSWSLEKDNPKIESLKSILEKWIKDEEKRVILWCNHPQTMHKLGEIFEKYNPLIVDGTGTYNIVNKKINLLSNDTSKRMDIVNEKRQDDSVKLIIANKVISTSITLTEFCKQIWWSLPLDIDYLKQANQRVCGVTQKEETVETYYLMINHSVDNYIWSDILHPQDKSKEVLDDVDKELSMKELKEIFNPKKKFLISGELNYYK